MNEIANLQPTCIWRNFDALTKVPRPSGHLEKVQQFLLDFAKRVGVEGFIDEGTMSICACKSTVFRFSIPGVAAFRMTTLLPSSIKASTPTRFAKSSKNC